MLQTIQEKYPARKVSSLYCAWTTRDGSPNSPLIAVWIDSSMRGFEEGIGLATGSDCAELNSDEPGGCVGLKSVSEPEIRESLETPQQ